MMHLLHPEEKVATRGIKKRNPIAKDLSDGRYHQRVVKDKTKYTRKEKYGQTDRHYEHSDSSETST